MPRGWIYTCIAATLFSGSLMADTSLSPTDTPWKATVEYLHFKPFITDTYFVINRGTRNSFPIVAIGGQEQNNVFNYHGGARVGLAYEYCDGLSQASLTYTRLETESCRRIEDNDPTFPVLSPTNGPASWSTSELRFVNAMESCLDFLYQRGDLMFERKVYCDCDLTLSVGVGVEAAELRLNSAFNTEDPEEDGHLRYRSRTDGIGPQLMLGATYNIFDHSCFTDHDFCRIPGRLDIKVRLGGSLLVGSTESSIFSDFTSNLGNFPPTISSDNQSHRSRRMIPVLHTRVGIRWETCFCNAPIGFEVGYELSNYYRAITEIIYPSDFSALSFSPTRNLYKSLGLAGLYLSASVNF